MVAKREKREVGEASMSAVVFGVLVDWVVRRAWRTWALKSSGRVR